VLEIKCQICSAQYTTATKSEWVITVLTASLDSTYGKHRNTHPLIEHIVSVIIFWNKATQKKQTWDTLHASTFHNLELSHLAQYCTTQLNSTQVYLKAVAERLKKDTMQCNGQSILKIQ